MSKNFIAKLQALGSLGTVPFFSHPGGVRRGFTLIELLVVVAIIGLLATVAMVSLKGAIERGKVAKAVGDAKALKTATEMYFNRMGFYPPDVGRGCDPGYLRPLPWSPDSQTNCGYNCNPGAYPYMPSDWCNLVQTRWDGPYLEGWRRFATAWGGLYDYNYWGSGASRYGCWVNPGVYIGVQGYYDNSNQMSRIGEKIMVDQKIDSDGCQNGEAQLLLFSL